MAATRSCCRRWYSLAVTCDRLSGKTEICVEIVSEERRMDIKKFGGVIVNGALQGKGLKGFRSIIESHI